MNPDELIDPIADFLGKLDCFQRWRSGVMYDDGDFEAAESRRQIREKYYGILAGLGIAHEDAIRIVHLAETKNAVMTRDRWAEFLGPSFYGGKQ